MGGCSHQPVTVPDLRWLCYVTAWLDLHSVSGAVKLAVEVGLIGPFPLILANAVFMSYTGSLWCHLHIRWLIKVLIVAVAVGWFFVEAVPASRLLRHVPAIRK
jgi:hypothetical protein